MNRKTWIAVILLLCIPAFAAAADKTLTRKADAIMLTGGQLQGLLGASPDHIGLLATAGGGLAPIPFQIDQRDAKGELVFPQGEKKSTDSDPAFDSNDELFFMIQDSGGQVADETLSAQGQRVVEVALTDPVDGTQAWVYAVDYGAPAPRSDTDYVRYDPTANTINAKNYTMGFSEKAPIAIGHLSLTPDGGGDNTNQIDRLKVRFRADTVGKLFEIEKNEDGFTSKVIAYIDGPVRVVRRTKNRQTLFWKIPTPSAVLDNIYYVNMFEFPTRVDLPFDVDMFLEKPKFHVTTDSLCSIPGRIFLNEKNPTPVQIDGVMSEAEKNLNMRPYKWMVIAQTGANTGGWMNRLLYDPEKTPAVPRLYYVDDMSKADGPEEEAGQCGNVGYTLDKLEEVEKGVLRLTSVMYNIPAFDASKVKPYLDILDHPVQAQARTVK